MKIVVHQEHQSRSIRDVLSAIKVLVAEGTQLSRQSGDARHTALLDKLAEALGMEDAWPTITHNDAVGWTPSYHGPPTPKTPTNNPPVARNSSRGSRIVRPGSTTAIATQLSGQPTTGSPSTKNYTTVFFTPERPLTKGRHPRDPETFCSDSEGKTFRMSRVLTDDERLAICQGRCRQMQKKVKEGWFALVILPPNQEAVNGNGELEDEGAAASSKDNCRDSAGTASTTSAIPSSLPSSTALSSPGSMPPPLFPASALRLSPRKKPTSLPPATNKAPNSVAQQSPRMPVPDRCLSVSPEPRSPIHSNRSFTAPDASTKEAATSTTAVGTELQVVKPLKRSRDEDEEYEPAGSSTVASDTKKRRVGAAVDVISPAAPEVQQHTALVRCMAGGSAPCRCPICDKTASFKFTFTCAPPKSPASPMFTFGQSSNIPVTRPSSPPMLTSPITASGLAPPTQVQKMLVVSPSSNPLKRARNPEDHTHDMSNESARPATRQRAMSSDDVPDSSLYFSPSDPARSRSAPPVNYVVGAARAVAVAEHGMVFGNRLKGAKNL
ncbi:unnamed protein product [Cyclocybe aegerita]|uniref:Uncharacterized protein n=1 Tax=Cyclocybe aegerita TaxID=1973307 RepID=A0A8S0W627_CYCAE|nr:unnamed protein product [Cyclocybe aegerita]